MYDSFPDTLNTTSVVFALVSASFVLLYSAMFALDYAYISSLSCFGL